MKMRGHKMLLAVFSLISLCTMVSTIEEDNTLTVEVTKSSDPKCGKYMQNHENPVLKIRYVRLLHTVPYDDDSDQWKSSLLCQPLKSDGYNTVEGKYTFKCILTGPPPPSINVIIFAVVPINQMMSSQIEYRYKEDTMRMFNFLKPETVMGQKFTHNSHLHFRNITYKVNGQTNFLFDDNCLNNYPDSLLADHGLYIRNGNEKTYTRMYFDSLFSGEKLAKPVII